MNRKRSLELGDINSQETDYEMPTQETKATKRDYTFRVREQIMPKELSPGRQYFKILSWNVNGLRSLATVNRKRLILLVEKHKPDLICLQETKIQDTAIHEYSLLLGGYTSFWNCSTTKKGYSGTAVFVNKATVKVPADRKHSGSLGKQTKLPALWKKGIAQPLSDSDTDTDDGQKQAPAHTTKGNISARPPLEVVKVSYDFEDEKKGHEGEGRTITVELDRFVLVACYVPNSGEGLRRLDYRVNHWEPHMRTYLRALSARKPVVLAGDLNCSHLDLDLHDPHQPGAHQLNGHTPQERAAFSQLLRETGFRDALRHFYPDAKGQFTFWDQYIASNRPHNKGVRLDYFLCSAHMFPPSPLSVIAPSGAAMDPTLHQAADPDAGEKAKSLSRVPSGGQGQGEDQVGATGTTDGAADSENGFTSSDVQAIEKGLIV